MRFPARQDMSSSARGKRSLVCSACGAEFTKTGNLNRHYRTQHHIQVETRSRDAGGELWCLHCERGFTKISNLYRHCQTQHQDLEQPRRRRARPAVSATTGLPQLCALLAAAARALDEDALDELVARARTLRAQVDVLLENNPA